MSEFIILTAERAAQVRGETAPGHFLDPRPLVGGELFVLPLSVLTDPAHAAQRVILETLPTRGVDPSEFPPRVSRRPQGNSQ